MTTPHWLTKFEEIQKSVDYIDGEILYAEDIKAFITQLLLEQREKLKKALKRIEARKVGWGENCISCKKPVLKDKDQCHCIIYKMVAERLRKELLT